MRHVHKPGNEPVSAFPVASAICCAAGAGSQTLGRARTSPGTPGKPRGWGELLRINPFASLFAASLIVFAPMHALAQNQDTREESVSVRDRDRPEYDAQGRRLGSFNLTASLDLAVTSTDNLFAAADGDPSNVDDIIYTAAPTIGLSSDWSRHAIAVDAGYLFRAHDEFSNEDADDYYIGANGRFDIGDNTEVHGSTRFGHFVSPRKDPDSPTIGAPVEYDRSDAGIGASHRFSRLRVSADVTTNERGYEGTQSFRDNQETAIRARLDYEFSPRFGLMLQAVADERDYDNSPQFDSDGTVYLAGVTLNTDLMRGEFSVGQFERDYAGVPNTFDGLALAGSVEWYITQLTTLTFNGRRDADDQIGATSGQPYITEEYGVLVDHELLRNVILTAGYRWGERDYETIARQDDYQHWEVGADYMLNRNAAVRFRYQHDEVDSPAYRSYDVNDVTVGLTLRL